MNRRVDHDTISINTKDDYMRRTGSVMHLDWWDLCTLMSSWKQELTCLSKQWRNVSVTWAIMSWAIQRCIGTHVCICLLQNLFRTFEFLGLRERRTAGKLLLTQQTAIT